MWRLYLHLLKPGIIMGNLVATLGGYGLASGGDLRIPHLFFTLLGSGLMVASGCVFNNYIDQDIDRLMQRTQHRGLAQGTLKALPCLLLGTVLGLAATACLYYLASPLSALLAVVGWVVYVGLYSLYFKRHSIHGTLLGSVAGAMPPVIGYCAVTPELNGAVGLLFLMFALWQMPHAFAIGIFRASDYQQAKIPVLPLVKGLAVTRTQILYYIPLFGLACLGLTALGYTGWYYGAVSLGFTVSWWALAYRPIQTNPTRWARQLFLASVLIVSGLTPMLWVDAVTAPASDAVRP
jgi:protoheme IX farnesyltransferase